MYSSLTSLTLYRSSEVLYTLPPKPRLKRHLYLSIQHIDIHGEPNHKFQCKQRDHEAVAPPAKTPQANRTLN